MIAIFRSDESQPMPYLECISLIGRTHETGIDSASNSSADWIFASILEVSRRSELEKSLPAFSHFDRCELGWSIRHGDRTGVSNDDTTLECNDLR